MHYLGEDDQMMGGYVGEVRQGADGNLYQWVEGIDGLGNSVGLWKRFKRLARSAMPYVVPGGVALKALQTAAPTLRQVLPMAQQAASLVPGAQAALTAANPLLRQAGVAGLGALYQAPDGSLYQMQGAEEDLQGFADGFGDGLGDSLGDGDTPQMMGQIMGIGSYVGEMRQGPDGNLYEWTAGVDGLGNPVGFWNLKKRLRKLVRKVMPIAQQFAPFIPGGSAALTVATPFLQRAGVAGGETEDLRGFAAEEDLQGYGQGYGEAEDMQGFAEDEDLRGYGEAEALYGYGEYGDSEALYGYDGYGEAEDMQGTEGYVSQDGMSGYEPQQSPTTRWFTPANQPPESWKSPW